MAMEPNLGRVVAMVDRDGIRLEIRVSSVLELETVFTIEVQSREYRGRARVSTYTNVLPSVFFREMARNWRGWEGWKEWGDLEQRCLMSASISRTGVITLNISLTDDKYEVRLFHPLTFDAGQLEGMAEETEALFESESSHL
jgi:hypothetical protein